MIQTAFTTGPLTAGTAADAGGGTVSWSNVNNAKVEDEVYALCSPIGPGSGGTANQLKTTNFGFALPSIAIIDGIKLEIKAQADIPSTPNVFLVHSGGNTGQSTVSNPVWDAAAWLVYGGATDLWGRSWTPAEINNSLFGASMSAHPGSGSFGISVDSVRITIYWHYSTDVSPADVPKRYIHKAFNGGLYLGNIPNVISKFSYACDINSVGSSLTIECGISADTASLPGDRIVTEAGDPLTTEAGEYIYTDGQPPPISVGSSVDPTILQNGNHVEVWEYSYYHPNGKLVFRGQINRIDAGFGSAADNKVTILLLSDGLDFVNYIARGSPFAYTPDVTQTSQNGTILINQASGKDTGWLRYGQTFVVGAGVYKMGAITVRLIGSATVTLRLWDSSSQTNLLGSVTQDVNTGGVAADVQFGFASLVDVVPGGTYFFDQVVGEGQSIIGYYNNVNAYNDGSMYMSTYGGGSGGGYSIVAGTDLYFKTASGVATTTATYTGKDPTTEMLKPIIDDYRLRGGQINYATGSIEATGLSLTVTFNTETVLDAIKKVLSVAPAGFYFYVDLGTNTLYFKNTLATPTYLLVKGRHLNKINLTMSIENVKNDLLFSGAETAGTNLYTEYEDQTSQSNYGVRLERRSDNRVSIQATADAIGNSFIDENKEEYYETTVTVIDRTIDTSLFRPGETVGLRGFASFVDTLTLQIVRVEYFENYANLTLGNLPKRFTNEFEKVVRGLVAEQTVANPSAPS